MKAQDRLAAPWPFRLFNIPEVGYCDGTASLVHQSANATIPTTNLRGLGQRTRITTSRRPPAPAARLEQPPPPGALPVVRSRVRPPSLLSASRGATSELLQRQPPVHDERLHCAPLVVASSRFSFPPFFDSRSSSRHHGVQIADGQLSARRPARRCA